MVGVGCFIVDVCLINLYGCLSMWTWLCGLLLSLSLVSGSRPRMESTCDTLANKIHLTKEEFNKAKELMRTCEEDVELMKCEGACVSTTMPSAMERLVHCQYQKSSVSYP